MNGKLENDSEKGETVLVIENFETSDVSIFELKDNDAGQNTPKVVDWIYEN